MKKTIFSLIISSLLASHSALATDPIREAQINRDIRASLNKDAQSSSDEAVPVELKSGSGSFLAVYREGLMPLKQGGVIILHDINQTADSPGIVRTLRTELNNNGWDTLSIQLPVTDLYAPRDEYYKLIDEATARLSSATQFYREKNNLNIGIVGHGFGGSVAISFMAASPPKEVTGVSIIGMDSRDKQTLENLEKIKVPLLDLFGSEDLPSVVETAPKRQRAVMLYGASEKYLQYRVAGADHNFLGLEYQLLTIISSWMDKEIAGQEINIGNTR
jgi:hypothetical protein